MGVTIYANNSSYSFDCGYGGFHNLQRNIAKAFDEEFGDHYATLMSCWNQEALKAFDEKANRILSDERFTADDDDILDFLFASDCDGVVSHRTCKKIYELIKDIDFGNKIFTYAAYSDGKDYEKFKEFLLECYSYHRKMRWC